MSLVSNRFTSLFCSVGAAALLAACPDSGEAPDARVETMFDAAGPDAPPADGGPDAAPDAAPDKLPEGTIAVLDVKITNDLTVFGIPALSGGAASISFTDPDFDEGVVTFGDPDVVPGCFVRVYDVALGQTPPPVIDEGPVAVTGATTPTVGGCVFFAAAGSYICPAQAPAAIPAGTVITKVSASAVSITFPVGTTLPTDNVGRGIILAGLEDAGNNTPAGSTFAIVQNPAPHIFVVANPAGVTDDTTAAAATFTILTGAGPTPAARDFLGANTVVTITKGAGMTTAVNEAITAAGEGFTLSTDSVKPEAMPITNPAANVKVSCVTAQGGVCGPDGAGGSVTGLVVTGRTTNVTPLPTFPLTMPAPTTGKVATFTCTFIGSSGNIPAAAWAAVLATSPTRIETRILRARAVSGDPGGNSIIVGHGLIGYTNVPPP